MFAPITRAQLHSPHWSPPLRGPRRTLVSALLRASALLVRTAVRLQQPAARPRLTLAWSADGCTPPHEPVSREFHAEAGAPEGALYVAGELAGHLPVTRL